MKSPYKGNAAVTTPGVATFLTVIGVLCLVIGGFAIIAAISDKGGAVDFAIAITLIVSGGGYLGFAYVVTALAKIVGNTASAAGASKDHQFQQAFEELVRARQVLEKLHTDNINRNEALSGSSIIGIVDYREIKDLLQPGVPKALKFGSISFPLLTAAEGRIEFCSPCRFD